MHKEYFLFILLFAGLSFTATAQEHKIKDPSNHSYGAVGYADSINSGLIAVDTLKASVHRTTMLSISGCHLHIEYSSPGVRGRTIWGGLVAYDEVWVTGAHNATALTISKPIKMDGKTIPAGTYAIFTIPTKGNWTFILNRNTNQHLADDYKQADDIVRIPVQPQPVSMTQRLTYTITSASKKTGNLAISWEKLSVNIPFEVL
jgi:hypothetical protein